MRLKKDRKVEFFYLFIYIDKRELSVWNVLVIDNIIVS